jgi:hypothetical protein
LRWHFLFKNNRTFITNNTNQAHEIHTLGQFKDDQFQGHEHRIQYDALNGSRWEVGDNDGGNPSVTTAIIAKTNYGTPRYGTTTHGKQIGVTYLIKVL